VTTPTGVVMASGKCVRCTPPLCTYTWALWWSFIWRQWRNIWGTSCWHIRGLGTRGYPSFCWPTKHQPMKPHSRSPPVWCAVGIYVFLLPWC
jgi:hypothetical protein